MLPILRNFRRVAYARFGMALLRAVNKAIDTRPVRVIEASP